MRPVRDLTDGARRIAGGDFDYTIEATTGDEIQVQDVLLQPILPSIGLKFRM